MTTRITLAILLTTWIVLIVGETGAFLIARQSMLALLDDILIARAVNAFEVDTHAARPSLPKGDRYQIRTMDGSLIAKSTAQPTLVPDLINKSFETGPDGRAVRVVELKMYKSRDGKYVPCIITYSRPTEPFNWLLAHLARQLLLISLACGLTTAWLSLKLSRAALRPLRETSDVIAQIDERQLSTRIAADDLPVELKPMAKRLNEMLSRLQGVFQQRKQFLADAAHELRTPTAALLTTLEVALRRPRDQAVLLEALQSGLADAQRLRRLVESLMEQARSDMQRPPPLLPIDIPAMLRECIQVIAPLAGEKGVKITLDPTTPAKLPFVTQPDRLHSVMLNLLSNAIEYNHDGGSVEIHCDRNGDGRLELTIRDTGVGIAPEQLPHVFEPFYRGGVAGRGDEAQHLGLGLFLVRSHVEALRGLCRINSEPGKGTTMHITIPEPPNVATPPAEQASARPEPKVATVA